MIICPAPDSRNRLLCENHKNDDFRFLGACGCFAAGWGCTRMAFGSRWNNLYRPGGDAALSFCLIFISNNTFLYGTFPLSEIYCRSGKKENSAWYYLRLIFKCHLFKVQFLCFPGRMQNARNNSHGTNCILQVSAVRLQFTIRSRRSYILIQIYSI